MKKKVPAFFLHPDVKKGFFASGCEKKKVFFVHPDLNKTFFPHPDAKQRSPVKHIRMLVKTPFLRSLCVKAWTRRSGNQKLGGQAGPGPGRTGRASASPEEESLLKSHIPVGPNGCVRTAIHTVPHPPPIHVLLLILLHLLLLKRPCTFFVSLYSIVCLHGLLRVPTVFLSRQNASPGKRLDGRFVFCVFVHRPPKPPLTVH